ncbi:MAG: hypothetical protein QM760_16315 [Nibricoccus sp.]
MERSLHSLFSVSALPRLRDFSPFRSGYSSNATNAGFPSKYGYSGSPSSTSTPSRSLLGIHVQCCILYVNPYIFETPGPVAIHGMCRLRGSSAP